MNTEVMFSSKTDEWETPQDLFDKLNEEFHFTLDVAANANNAKCADYLDKNKNGLNWKWGGYCFMNPPYGREIGKWIKKAYEESMNGCTVVCLLPARTDTKWFHEYILSKAEIRFIKGRLKFGGHKNAAPFPSMIVIYRGVKV
jgi:phage N-6-adenine-methyltransferase